MAFNNKRKSFNSLNQTSIIIEYRDFIDGMSKIEEANRNAEYQTQRGNFFGLCWDNKFQDSISDNKK